MSENGENPRPPRDNLYRFFPQEVGVREENDASPRLVGHFAKFNEWAEINSRSEGRFLERIAPGAFKRTFSPERRNLRVLFQHGRDQATGEKPIGTIQDLREDEEGARYEVELFDVDYVHRLLPALRAGEYGASFRFRAVNEDIERDAEESEWNPNGLPERTITEAEVREFGPVTFPAYEGATATIRSLTDEFLFERLVSDPEKLEELLSFLPREKREEVSSEEDENAPTARPQVAAPGRRSRKQTLYGLRPRKEQPSWRI